MAITAEQLLKNALDLTDQKDAKRSKMVLCVRTDLGMTKGKMCAQCCHAALGLYRDLLCTYSHGMGLISDWDACGQTKVAVKVKSETELQELYEAATKLKIPAYIVVDAGATQVPCGSKTVMALGPVEESLINQVTGKFGLL